jgi:putative sigma-54 modulation protein
MQIDFTGRGLQVPEEIKSLAERKLGKLEKVLRGVSRAHVILTADRHRQIAEVSVHSPHLTLTAVEESGDLGASLATVIEKLTRQAQRHSGKLRKRRGSVRTTALWAGVVPPGDSRGEGVPRIIRSRRFVPKPMTMEEALLEVSASDDGFLVFRDAATERMNVLYRRKDGNLGLIEPEA